jgi:hypothetical protein
MLITSFEPITASAADPPPTGQGRGSRRAGTNVSQAQRHPIRSAPHGVKARVHLASAW